MSSKSAGPPVGVRHVAPPAAVPDAGRPIERSIAVDGGVLACPRKGTVQFSTCDHCPFFCKSEAEPASVICSYPIPACETFAWRSRRDDGVRIALRHRLERT